MRVTHPNAQPGSLNRVDWSRYKALSDDPRYFPRWMLLRSLAVLEAQDVEESADESAVMEIAAELRAALAKPPLELPEGHTGDPRALMHRLVLTRSQAALMVTLFQDKAVAVGALAKPTLGKSTAVKSGAGFHAAWLEHYTSVGSTGVGDG